MLPTAFSHKIKSGLTLIEMLVAIVIVSIALTGMLNAMTTLLRHSVDPVIESQGLALVSAINDSLKEAPFSSLETKSWDTLSSEEAAWVDWAKRYKFQCDITVSQVAFLSVPKARTKAVTIRLKHRKLSESGLVWKDYVFLRST